MPTAGCANATTVLETHNKATPTAAPVPMDGPIQAKLAALIGAIARSDDVRSKLFQQGWQVAGTSPEGLANRIKADTSLLGGVIAARGIKAE